MFNFEQVKGIAERVLTIVVAYAVGKGIVPEALQHNLVELGLMAISVVIGWYVNRPASLAAAAEKTS